jgi:hypothetical protein
MPNYSRFAPHSTPDVLDRLLWWLSRIAPVVFLISVLIVTFFTRASLVVWLVIISAIVWFIAYVLRWALFRFWND